MKPSKPPLYLSFSLIALHSPLLAQALEESILVDDQEIVVQGDRLRGSLNVVQAPIIELNEADITTIGATSIEELLSVLVPNGGSARGRGGGGRPITLINGVRVSSFREVGAYPPEAIAKVEVLPEEVAQQFGYPPNVRVVNFILKENFESYELEFEAQTPERGGYLATEEEFTFLRISKSGRLNFNIEVEDTTLLTEGERGVLQTEVSNIPTDPDQADFRSLLPDQLDVETSVSWAKLLDSGTSLSTNVNYNRAESRNLSGFNSVSLSAPDGSSALRIFGEETPLERRSSSDTFSFSGSLSRRIGSFDLTATADAIIAMSETRIDRRFDTAMLEADAAAGALAIDAPLPGRADNGFDISSNDTTTTTNKVTLRGHPLSLPAGEVATTFYADFDWKRIESDDTRTAGTSALTRRRLAAGANVTIPIAQAGGPWGAIGTVSLNGSAGFEDLSDFGTLYDWTAGISWDPVKGLNLSATRIVRQAAPFISQLGDPQVASLNVPTFDFVRGETVLATTISGGNPDLLAETQRDWKFSANWDLSFWPRTRLSVDYVRNRSRNVTSGFPALTAEIEAAFPGRIVRDANGRVELVDTRPVTFAQTQSDRLVFGLNTFGSFGSNDSKAGEEADDQRVNYTVIITHDIELTNEVLIAPGLAPLDLLGGDSTSSNGLPRHTSRLLAAFNRNGKGLWISGRYTGKASINGSGLPSSNEIFFGDIATVDLRVFLDFGSIFEKEKGALKNLRLILRVNNLFDAQRRIVDSNGDVPLRYQPFLVDPLGRTFRIDLRKLF